jgi:uncharacterized protein (DUF2252 family)
MEAEESIAFGRAARARVPRSSHADWRPAADRPDPVGILLAQATTRQQDLVPLRHSRMLESPFAFYRGGAAIMAADLAGTATSGIDVQCCGDAHLANFGGFQSPERTMVFDINDFDETLPGPWEWDIKRLAASLVLASRSRGFDDALARLAVLQAVGRYRRAMRDFAAMRNLDVWYARLDLSGIVERWGANVSRARLARMERNVQQAREKNSLKAFAKLTERVDGTVRIRHDPPLVERFEAFLPEGEAGDLEDRARGWISAYRRTLQPDRRHALDGFRIVDFARKVVGVGSVGTRCWVALLIGRDHDDPLFLQVKEAEASVLEPYLRKSKHTNHGQRVVSGQRLMQAASDIFLGWERAEGPDGRPHDFYLRQLWDGKLSADLTTIEPGVLPVYAQMCSWTLARAHARSGDRIAIASYLGAGDTFDRAIVEFALTYADQNTRDFDAATAAAEAGVLATMPAALAGADASQSSKVAKG